MKSRWTLRRIQIAAIIAITALFLARVFIPPLTPQARAEKLYLDGWFLTVRLSGGGDRETDKKKSVEILEQALALSPGNSLYEQALVWRCPEKDLQKLIKNGGLDKKVLILANHRYYTYLDKQADNDEWKRSTTKPKNQSPYSASDMFYSTRLHPPEYWRKKLERLEKLATVDPGNALIRYRRAYIFGNMGRQSDMLSEVRKANAMDLCAIRMPEVLPAIQNTMADPRLYGFFGDSAQLRELARQMVGYSNEQLRAKNVSASLATSEEACRMGVRLASMEPVSYINYLVAAAVFSIGRSKLDAICRNFGMTEEIRKYQNVSTEFDKGLVKIRDSIQTLRLIPQPYTGIASCTNLMLVSVISFAIFLTLWGMASLARRIMHRQKVDIKAWDEGWLLKLLSTVYLPVILVILIAGTIWYKQLFPRVFVDLELIGGIISRYLIWITIAMQVVLATILMLKLKKQYSISAGEKVSLLRFKLRIPMQTRAWICRSYTLFFGVQMIFLLCFGMLASQIFISHYAANPWQIARIPLVDQDVEKVTAQKASDEMKKFAIEKSITKGNNSEIGRVSGR